MKWHFDHRKACGLRTQIVTIPPPFWRLAVANCAVFIGLDAQYAYFCLPFVATLLQRMMKLSSGAPRKARLPSASAALRAVCDILNLWRYRTIGLDDQHTQRVAALRLAPRLHLPNSTVCLGTLSVAFAPSFEFGSHRHKPTCWGRCVLWSAR